MKLGLLGLSVALAATLAAACGGADQNATNNDTGGQPATGGGNTGGKATGGDDTGGANTGGAGTGGGGNTGGGSNTGGAGGTMMGGPCGGIAGTPCGDTQYCDFDEDSCGSADQTGTCEDKPSSCPDVVEPVCACDGKVYNNACEAAADGVDISLLGGCPAPPGGFPCGAGFCDQASEFCQVVISDVAGDPNVYTCHELPPNCLAPDATCACLSDLPCGSMCEEADGGFTLTCPGG